MNSSYFLLVFWTVISVWLLISFAYWYSVRPYLCDGVRFNLFALRDELRKIEFTTNTDKFSFRFLENVLNTGINVVDHVSIGSFLEYKFIHNNLKDAPELKDIHKFDSEAPESLKELDRKFCKLMLQAMIINSPCWYCFARIIGVFFKLSNSNNPITKFKKQSRDLVHLKQIPV